MNTRQRNTSPSPQNSRQFIKLKILFCHPCALEKSTSIKVKLIHKSKSKSMFDV